MKFILLTISIVITFKCQSQNIYCNAEFSCSKNGTVVSFSDLSVVVPADPWSMNYSLSWAWEFGDGNISTLQSPTYSYMDGFYVPCLTITFFDSTAMSLCTSYYCDSIAIGLTTIKENDFNNRIVKVLDINGKSILTRKNIPLFYIYDDGTVEKKIIFE